MTLDVADIELKFIKAVLTSRKAFSLAQGVIDGYDFSHPYLNWLWPELIRYKQDTGHKPGIELLELTIPYLDDELAVKAKIFTDAIESTAAEPNDIEFYINELVKRKRLQAQVEGIMNAQRAMERGDEKASAAYLKAASMEMPGVRPKTKAGLSYGEDDVVELYPTGLAGLDYIIGGIARQEVGLVMGVTGVGKSITAVNLGWGMLKVRWQKPGAEYRIWHIDTENGERVTNARYISRFTGIPYKALETGRLTTEQRYRLDAWLERNEERLARQLFIYPAEYLGTTIEDIERELAYLEADGRLPDEMIFDSPDHLWMGSGADEARWERFADTYSNLRALVRKFDIAAWTITQAKLEFERKTATTAAVADSKQKSRLAHLVLSINEDRDDPLRRFVWVAKNRTGASRFRVDLDIDWPVMRMSTLGESLEGVQS